MNHNESYLKQVEDVKAHMGELRSTNGERVERLLADLAAEPTISDLLKRYPPTITEYPQGWMACNDAANIVITGPDEAYVRELYSLSLHEVVAKFGDPDTWPKDPRDMLSDDPRDMLR